MKRSSTIVIQRSLDGLQSLQIQLDDLCKNWNIDEKTGFELNLILEELLINSMVHSNQSSEKDIEINLMLKGEELLIRVIEEGPPFNPEVIPPPDIHEPIETRKPGGLGIHFIRHFTDSITYVRENGRNLLTISKHL